MKKYISTALLVFCSVLYTSGQIQLEHTFNYSATVTLINDNVLLKHGIGVLITMKKSTMLQHGV